MCARLAKTGERAGEADARAARKSIWLPATARPRMRRCARASTRRASSSPSMPRRWGTGGAGAGAGFQRAVPAIYDFPNRRAAAPRRVHQRRAAARVPGPGTSAGVLHHRSRDRRARRSCCAWIRSSCACATCCRRIQPPEAGSANGSGGSTFRSAAEKIGWSQRHPTGDPASGPIKRGLGCAANRLGRRRQPRDARHLRDPPGRQRARRRSARRTSAPARARWSRWLPPRRWGCRSRRQGGDRRYELPVRARQRRQRHRRIGLGNRPRRVRERARRAVCQGGARRSASQPAALVANGGRIQVKSTPVRRACRGGTRASCSGFSRSAPTARPAPGLTSTGTSGVQFADVEVDIETGVTRVKRIVCVQDCGTIVDKLTAESQVYRRHHHGSRVRDVRAPHSRSQHGAHGEPEHGVVSAARDVGHPGNRHHAGRSAGPRASSASASRRSSRRRRPSRMRSPTPSACACAACRSRPTRC